MAGASPSDLLDYRPSVPEPVDFDDFWRDTLAEARSLAVAPEMRPYAGLPEIEVIDVRYSGFEGHPIAAWLLRPRSAVGAIPTVVGFNGYGGGRGLPHEHLAWVAAGYGYAFMDTRGQGAWWGAGGSTADPVGTAPSAPGFATNGIENPRTYYYRRVYTDAVRLVETLRALPEVDPVAVTGISQGGGIAIAVAGLVDGLRAVLPDVPFGNHWRYSVENTAEDPYGEIRRYLSVHSDRVDAVFATLGYVEGIHFAARATAPALFSAGLMDPVCLPPSVYATHNAWGTTAQIAAYPFGDHGGGGPRHFLQQVEFLREVTRR